MRLYISIYQLVLFLFVPLCINATNYYVDNTVSTSGNGLSWGTAWKNFSDINWGVVEPGDIVYISGGMDSTVYYEPLAIEASGNPNHLVTVRNSYEAGHNGRVIIDGVDYSGTGILIGSSVSLSPDYVYVKGLEVRRFHNGVYLHYEVRVITLDSLIVTDNYARGMFLVGNNSPREGYCIDSVTIKNCTVITPLDLDSQTDCLYIDDIARTVIDHNYMRVRNYSSINNHSDVIQAHIARGIRITNNVFICDSNAQGMDFILGAIDLDDDTFVDSVIIYNNYCFMGGIWFEGAPWVAAGNNGWDPGFGGEHAQQPPVIVIHNTFVTNGPYVNGFHMEGHAEMMNNIMAMYGDGSTTHYHEPLRITPLISIDSVRHNLMWQEWLSGGDHFDFRGYIKGVSGNVGQCHSWDSWVNTYGGTGVCADPLFVDQVGHMANQGDLSGELQAGSPARNAGENIQAIIESMGLPWTDINGNPRDSHPDIGAYEYAEEHGNLDTKNYSYTLNQNYPNPFNPSTTIEYYTPQLSWIKLVVYNSIAQEVQLLVDEEKASGLYKVEFNAANLSSGVYFYELQSANFVETKKMVLIK